MLHTISTGHSSHLVQHAAQQQHVGFQPARPPLSSKTRQPLQQSQAQQRPVIKARFQLQQQQQQASPTTTGVSISGGGVDFADGTDAAAMVSFLSAYGLDPAAIERLLQECPRLFEGGSSSSTSTSSTTSAFGGPGSCTAGWSPYSYEEEAAAAAQEAAAASGHGCSGSSSSSSSSVYEVGRTLLFFHSLGWSHSSVMRRIIGLYPQLLTKQVERDILPVLAALADMGCSEADVQLLVWEFPRIFVSSNWRRHVRKFQYLGLYGLPPPGHTTSSRGSSSAADSLERLMRWL